MFGKKPVSIRHIHAVAGPRVGALEVDFGFSSGDALKRLRADDHALLRQIIPWQFAGEPIAFMSRRYVRIEAGWPPGISVTDIRLKDLSVRGAGSGRWIAGMNERGATITLGFSDRVPHFLVGGYTGSGKTYAMRTAVAQLAQDDTNRLVLLDGKFGDGMMPLQHLPNVLGPVAIDLPTAKQAISYVVAEMRHRYETGHKPTRIIVVIDEIQEFTRDDAFSEMVRILAAQGRGARIHLLIGTQHPKAEAFGDKSAIKRNLPGRVALQTEDYKASEVVVGGPSPRADKLMGAGDAYAITPGAVHRTQLAYIPDHELERDWCTANPLMDTWPSFDPAAAGTLPMDDAPRWQYSPQEIGIALVQAHLGAGRPTLQKALTEAGLACPGSIRADRLLALGRDIYTQLRSLNWALTETS